MSRGSRNIFISHRHVDDHRLDGLKNLLRRDGRKVRDSSVYSGNGNRAKNEHYIRHLLSRRMRWAGTLLVLVSNRTRHSRWVKWEIERAQKMNKRIVGIWAENQDECAVPGGLRAYADAMVPWDGSMIWDAIDGHLTGWHGPDGVQRPICPLPPITC